MQGIGDACSWWFPVPKGFGSPDFGFHSKYNQAQASFICTVTAFFRELTESLSSNEAHSQLIYFHAFIFANYSSVEINYLLAIDG